MTATRPSDGAPMPMRDWGLVGVAELARPVIVSPHLDDAVLGCGLLMAEHAGAVCRHRVRGQPAAVPDADALLGRAGRVRAR